MTEMPSSRAWRLIKTCAWSNMGTSEKFALLALARAQAEQMIEDELIEPPPVTARTIAGVWGCSPQNAEEFLNRPRVRGAIEIVRGEGRDGKTRRYYSLSTEWDHEK